MNRQKMNCLLPTARPSTVNLTTVIDCRKTVTLNENQTRLEHEVSNAEKNIYSEKAGVHDLLLAKIQSIERIFVCFYLFPLLFPHSFAF